MDQEPISTLQILILIPQGIHLYLVNFGIPIYRMAKAGGLVSNIVLCWVLHILWAILWCILLPEIVSRFDRELIELFPEGAGVVAVVMLGWLPAAVVCTIAYIIIGIVKWRHNRPGPPVVQ